MLAFVGFVFGVLVTISLTVLLIALFKYLGGELTIVCGRRFRRTYKYEGRALESGENDAESKQADGA